MHAGVMYIRQSKQVRSFLQAWDDLLAGQITRVDLIGFNTLVADRFQPLTASPVNPRLAFSLKDGMSIGVLSPALFANGHTFSQRLHEVNTLSSYLQLAGFSWSTTVYST